MRPEIIEVPVVRYAPVPAELVAPLEPPGYPEGTLTNGDLVQRVIDLEAFVRRLLADRERIRQAQTEAE